jgi:hypothetical protein
MLDLFSFMQSIYMIYYVMNRDTTPRYESMCLQAVLSPRHLGWSRASVMGGKSLLEFCEGGDELSSSIYTTDMSVNSMMELGLISYNQVVQI